MIALLAFAGIGVLLAILYLFILPGHKETAAATTPALEEPGVAGAATSHPLAKHIEVTGLRLEGLKNGRIKIQYVAVNHSSADLPELNLLIALRSTDRTFFEFPATLPSLGPFESKDMTAVVKTELKPYELPDWQMLRPQFRVQNSE